MCEQFARWLLVVVAVAVTLLGRPGSACDRASIDDEALRGSASELSLIREERRTGGVQKSSPSAEPDALTSAPATWVPCIAWVQLDPFEVTRLVDRRRESVATARGPPIVAV